MRVRFQHVLGENPKSRSARRRSRRRHGARGHAAACSSRSERAHVIVAVCVLLFRWRLHGRWSTTGDYTCRCRCAARLHVLVAARGRLRGHKSTTRPTLPCFLPTRRHGDGRGVPVHDLQVSRAGGLQYGKNFIVTSVRRFLSAISHSSNLLVIPRILISSESS